MFSTVADAGKDSSAFAPLMIVPTRSESLPRRQLARQLWERVLVDRPLDETIPENHLRAKLKKLGYSVVVE
jgi:hypothetical protein